MLTMYKQTNSVLQYAQYYCLVASEYIDFEMSMCHYSLAFCSIAESKKKSNLFTLLLVLY